jgi:Flp pilus assembly pilin Flp
VQRVPRAQSGAVGICQSRARVGTFRRLWQGEKGQDVAEYAVMLAVILAIAIGTIRLIGSHAGGVLANVGSAIQ